MRTKLQEWLAEQGISYQTFGDHLDTTRQTAHNLASGVQRFTLEQALLIVKYTGGEIQPCDLLTVRKLTEEGDFIARVPDPNHWELSEGLDMDSLLS